MTKKQLWDIYCKKNPSFMDDEKLFRMTGKGVRKLFEQTYDIAYKEGVESASGGQKNCSCHSAGKEGFDIFNDIFNNNN